MESSRLYYYFLKLAGVMFVFMCAYAMAAAVFFPDEIQSDSPVGIGDRIFIATIFPLLGLLLGFVGWRAAYVKIHAQHLEVIRNGKRLEVPWAEVSGVTKMSFITPPLYRIRFDSHPSVFVTARSWIVLSVGFWSWDFSDFREALEGRIAEAMRQLNST